MLQVVLISLILGVYLHDGWMPAEAAPLPWWGVLAGVVLPKLGLGGVYWLACRRVSKRLSQAGNAKRLRRLDRLTTLLTLAALPLYALDLAAGALLRVRGVIGDPVLLDELLVMLPVLVYLLAQWAAYYPIERRLREASLMRRIDEGLPVAMPPARWAYVWSQARHQMGLILPPLWLLLAWAEAVRKLSLGVWEAPVTLAGSGVIFLLAPLLICRVFDTVPLPPGSVRDHLLSLCTRYGIRVRDLLVWRTMNGGGGMVNAAVMGLIPRVRFILLTDALLETVPERSVEAVMAHELAHVRFRHTFWLVVLAAAPLVALEWAVRAVLAEAPDAYPGRWDPFGVSMEHVAMLGEVAVLLAVGVAWVLVFGWLSRRVERQADAFAVRHLAADASHIPEAAVRQMVTALDRIATLNGLPVARRNYRHGSIRSRQRYLHTLIGRDSDDLPIDRQMRWLRWLAAVVLLTGVAVGVG